MKNKKNLNNNLTLPASISWYYTGFCHADGSFFISIEKKSNSVWGFRLNPMFAIALGIDSLDLIRDIAHFFGCGNIYITKQGATFRVTNFYHIWHIIIPHFLKYPFSGRKFLTFKIFTICCSLMLPFYNKTLPYSVIFKIIYLSFLMNEGSKRSIENFQSLIILLQEKAAARVCKERVTISKAGQVNQGLNTQKGEELFNLKLISSLTNEALSINNFPSEFNILPANFKLISPSHYIELPYILGIFEGDGSFFIRFTSSRNIYAFGFNITTSIDDLPILILIKNRLGCGKIVLHKTWCRLDINKIEDLNNIIIPLVESLPCYRGTVKGLLSHKAEYYTIWKEGIKSHLNGEFSFQIDKCKSIKEHEEKKRALKNYITRAYNLHNEGKKRKLPLNQFLKLHDI